MKNKGLELAKAFNMKSSEFCDFIGYTRQNLSLFFKGQNSSKRMSVAIEKLEMQANILYIADAEELKQRDLKRREYIKILRGEI